MSTRVPEKINVIIGMRGKNVVFVGTFESKEELETIKKLMREAGIQIVEVVKPSEVAAEIMRRFLVGEKDKVLYLLGSYRE